MPKHNPVEDALSEIRSALDEATEDLSDAQYIEVLEELIADVQTRIDAKQVEMK